MKHIAFIVPTIDQIGGAERQVLLLAKELAAREWQVTLVALSGTGGGALEELADAKVAYLSLDMRKAWIDPRGWLRYIRWARQRGPEIVHSHLPHATWFARWVRLLVPTRVLIDTLHTSNARGLGKRIGYRLSHWLTSHVTCVSQSVADAALAASLISPKSMTILPNGVALLPPAAPRSEMADSFLWIAVGRLAPVKDYPTLLHAFATLEGNPRLLIAGTGPEDRALRQLTADLRIEARVHFAGFQQVVQPLLDAADAFVLTSLWEGLPVSILEAQAAGLPIVATRAAGTSEAMIENQTGLLVAVGDVVALGLTMTRIMTMSVEERKQFGARGRRFVEQNFSLTAIAARWESLYNELLQSNHDSR